MTYQRIASIVLWGLLALSIILVGLFFFGNYVPGTAGTPMEEPMITNKILLWAFILLIIATVVALAFPLMYLAANPKNAIRPLIILVIVAALVFVAFLLASDEVLHMPAYNGGDNIPAVLKKAGTGLILTYILAVGALAAILFTEIAKLFK